MAPKRQAQKRAALADSENIAASMELAQVNRINGKPQNNDLAGLIMATATDPRVEPGLREMSLRLFGMVPDLTELARRWRRSSEDFERVLIEPTPPKAITNLYLTGAERVRLALDQVLFLDPVGRFEHGSDELRALGARFKPIARTLFQMAHTRLTARLTRGSRDKVRSYLESVLPDDEVRAVFIAPPDLLGSLMQRALKPIARTAFVSTADVVQDAVMCCRRAASAFLAQDPNATRDRAGWNRTDLYSTLRTLELFVNPVAGFSQNEIEKLRQKGYL